jgi:Fe-S cluster assembly scaffold protein SufB
LTDALDLAWATEEVVRDRSRSLEEPDWLLERRLASIRRYAELPAEGNRLWTTYLDLRSARLAEVEPYGEAGEGTEIDERLPEGASALIHIHEDTVVARALSPEARDAGVVVDTFRNVLRERPDLLQVALETEETLPVTDKFAQLTAAMSVAGVLVRVPDGVDLAGPIVVRWSVGEPGRGLVSRTVVSLGRDAHASLLEEQLPSGAAAGDRQSLFAGTTEVRLEEGATLDVAAEHDFGPETVSFLNRQAIVGRDATIRWALASVGGALIKSRIDNLLVGRGATVKQAEIGFGGGSQLFDLSSYTRHSGQDTTSDLLSKGVFQDRSRGYFKGLIEIQKSATGTDSFLGEFAMLLAKKARSVAIPSLEIDQPDVRRASHASSVAPIDEAQIFYLQSRGLPRDMARKFIVLGFLEPVVARIPLPDAQARLRDLFESKWLPTSEVEAPAA